MIDASPEDCTRCGGSLIDIIDRGCPLGASTWCLRTRLEAVITNLNAGRDRDRTSK
jgi:hypothetical protein